MKKIILMSFLFFLVVPLFPQVNREEQLNRLEQDSQVQPTATLKSASRLFEAKDDLTSVMLIIPSGSVVSITGEDSTYYRVIYEDAEGYILRRHAVLNREASVQPVPANEPAQEVRSTRPVQKSGGNRFSYLDQKYGTSMAARLYAGKIWKGMTAEMVKDSWGTPSRINRVIRGNTIKEEWIYRNTWLYIVDDRLVDWGPAVKK